MLKVGLEQHIKLPHINLIISVYILKADYVEVSVINQKRKSKRMEREDSNKTKKKNISYINQINIDDRYAH